jgi:hypothetical protein
MVEGELIKEDEMGSGRGTYRALVVGEPEGETNWKPYA